LREFCRGDIFDFFNRIGAKRSFGEPTITLEAKAWLTSRL
jgi:hypothetical protein